MLRLKNVHIISYLFDSRAMITIDKAHYKAVRDQGNIWEHKRILTSQCNPIRFSI